MDPDPSNDAEDVCRGGGAPLFGQREPFFKRLKDPRFAPVAEDAFDDAVFLPVEVEGEVVHEGVFHHPLPAPPSAAPSAMAYVRHRFFDVFAPLGSIIAEEAIRRIAEHNVVEREARGKAPDDRVTPRQARAKPFFDDLEAWLHAQLFEISGKSPPA